MTDPRAANRPEKDPDMYEAAGDSIPASAGTNLTTNIAQLEAEYTAYQAELKQLQARMAEAEALVGEQEAPATRSYNPHDGETSSPNAENPSNPYDTAFIDHASN